MSKRRRAAGPARARARAPDPRGRGREADARSASSFRGLLRRSLTTYAKALPAIAAVTLAAQLPTQIFLGVIFERRGITSSFWQEQYRSLGDLVIGSLILPAIYSILYQSTQGQRLADLPRTLRWAYGRGLFGWVWTWLGMFMTRFLVSFVVGAAMLPAMAGAWGVSRAWPEIGRLVAAPEQLASAAVSAPTALAPLLLAAPLLALPLVIFLRYALAEPAVALERVDGFEALKRSQELVSGAGVKWRLLAGLVVLDLPYEAASMALPEIAAPLGQVAVGAAKACCLVLGVVLAAFLVEVFLAEGGEPRDERKPAAPRPEPAA
jgi:hypothetical protein